MIEKKTLLGFNWKDYILANPDLLANWNSPFKAITHYVIFGIRERRSKYPTWITPIDLPRYLSPINFDWRQYINDHPDLQEAGINTKEKAYRHYLKHGNREKRRINSPIRVFDQREIQTSIKAQRLAERIRLYKLNKSKRKARVVVYTAVIGNHDRLTIPDFIVNDWDYVCFSDGKIEGNDLFEIRTPDYFDEDPVRTARFIKTHPHYYFPEYEYTIWLDANIIICGNHLNAAINDCMNRNVLFMCNPHPHRDCVYDELVACLSFKVDNSVLMKEQVMRYQNAGHPRNYGLLETNILIRKHNYSSVIELDNAWWSEIDKGSRRDQLSIMPLLRIHNLPFEMLRKMVDVRSSSNKNYAYVEHKFAQKLEAGKIFYHVNV